MAGGVVTTRGGAPRNSTRDTFETGSGVTGRDAEADGRGDFDELDGVASWMGHPDACAISASVVDSVGTVCCEAQWLGDVAETLFSERSTAGGIREGSPSWNTAAWGTSAAFPTDDSSCPAIGWLIAFDTAVVGVALRTGDSVGQPRSRLGVPFVTVGSSATGASGIP